MVINRKKASENKISEFVKKIYDLMLEDNIGEVEWEESSGFKIKLTRQGVGTSSNVTAFVPQGMTVPGKALEKDIEEDKDERSYIRSPMNGIFYRASSPSAESFVKENDEINIGATVCIIEAMKLMNEVQVERHCKIKKILVENGAPVKTSQPLFEIDDM